MIRCRLSCPLLFLVAFSVGLLCGRASAEAPLKISELVVVEDLVSEAQAKSVELAKHLASREAYVATKKGQLAQVAGTLACVAQAISEHSDAKKVKVAGPALRDAALALRNPKSFEDAKLAEKAVNAALKGEGEGKIEFSWAKLIAREAMMEEINTRNSKLRRVIRRSRKPSVDSLHASTMAVLSVAMYADAHGHDDDKAQLAEWREISKESVGIMASIAGAIKKKDAAGAKRLYVRAIKTCTDCHEKFRD
ncbi:MAG: hypothetical protein ABGZ17_31630 [Planctomycetaceae bacterium]